MGQSKEIEPTPKKQLPIKGFWFNQFGGMLTASHGFLPLNDAIEALDNGWTTPAEWKKVAEQEVIQYRDIYSDEILGEASPFSDEFITHFWDSLRPLMNQMQILELKKHHPNLK